MKPVQVISYSGYKADESPRLLKIGDTVLPIALIEDRWYSPGETFFRILTQTGDRYLLRHVEAQDVWTLEGFRSHRVDGVAQRAGKGDPPLAAALFRCN
jgi:hypothetical protein